MPVKQISLNIFFSFLLLAPVILVFNAPSLASILSGPDSQKAPFEVLKKGGGFALCDGPFRQYVKDQENKNSTVNCSLVQGRNMLAVDLPEPRTDDVRRRAKQGVLFEFPEEVTKRLAGRDVIVSVTASCLACARPFDVVVVSGIAQNMEWTQLEFGEKVSTKSFKFSSRPRFAEKPSGPLQIVVDPYQEADSAIIRIASVSIEPVD